MRTIFERYKALFVGSINCAEEYYNMKPTKESKKDKIMTKFRMGIEKKTDQAAKEVGADEALKTELGWRMEQYPDAKGDASDKVKCLSEMGLIDPKHKEADFDKVHKVLKRNVFENVKVIKRK